MKVSSLSLLVFSALGLVSAAPSPKRPAIKYPNLKRPNHISSRSLLEKELLHPEKRWWTAEPTEAPKTNIWRALSNSEAAAVIKFMHNQEELNLTASGDAGPWDNQLSVVETLNINKTDALAYLAGSGPEPARWARVSVMFGATDEPYLEDFMVGPLPEPTTYAPLSYTTTKGTSKIKNYDADSDALYEWIYSMLAENQDFVMDLCGGTVNGSDSDTLDVWGIDPLWHEEGRVVSWMTFWRYDTQGADSETLMPQGLFFKIDMTGRDPSNWSLLGWLYNDIYYTSTAEFRAAWSSSGFEKAGVHNEQGEWGNPIYNGEALPLDHKPAPMAVSPGEARYTVDYDNQYVKWMDFEFYIAFSRNTGVRLFDIKYKGERIFYELGLEEAIAHYAGNDPMQSGTAYLDTFYGFGPYAFALLPGYDCPTYATFLNSTFHVDELSKTHRNSICLFEFEKDFPIEHHSTSKFVAVTKNVAFVLRSTSTVGNYDYQFTYEFYRDGTIEVTVRASGYIQSAYFLKNDEYGYKIHDALSGSMHDHSLNFKADLDILGTKNTMAEHKIVPVQENYVWSNYTRSTMKLQRSFITNENESKLLWSKDSMYIIQNKDQPNKYGEYRGYRIMPSHGSGMHLTITNSSNLFDSQNFATHDLYVTKQKDTEPHSAHANNDYDTRNPIVDFGKFFDGEDIEQEDIVVWFNLGMHHLPNTNDLPITLFSTAQSSVQFVPHNYLLGTATRNVQHQVRVDYNTEGVQKVTEPGENPSGTLKFQDTVPKLWSYQGDIAVRKFPYDPANPFNDTESIV